MPKLAGQGALLPFVDLDPGDRVPLHQQLTQQLRVAILTGQLHAGQRLPASRTLAAQLQVSRSTVVAAFEQLVDEGYLESDVGSGTFVSSLLPVSRPRPAAIRPHTGRRHSGPLSKRGRQLAKGFGPAELEPFPVRAFAPNIPALDLFPTRTWNRLTNRVQRNPGRHLMRYGEPAGFRPLRRAIADYVSESRGVNCEADQVIVTSGTQKAIHLAASLLLDPDDQVLMEDPGGVLAGQVFRAQGARVLAAPVDDDGLDVARALAMAPNAKLAYLTPSCQYPLGATLPIARRLDLLEWAARRSAWILEDDEDSEFRFVGRPVPSMQGLDRAGRVIYAWSFSEVLFPSLRLGVLVVPPDLVEPFSVASGLVDRGPSTWPQAVLYEFINDGYFASHIRRMRSAYAARKQALLDAAAAELSGLLELRPVESGLRVFAELPQGLSDRDAEREADRQGMTCYALSRYCQRRRDMQGLILGFSCTPPDEMRGHVGRLVRVLDELTPSGRV